MASSADSWRCEFGPVDGSGCDHGSDVLFPDDPHSNGYPLFELAGDCSESAALRLPHPNGLGQGIDLCEHHVRRYREHWPKQIDRLVETGLIDPLSDSDRWVDATAAPPKIGNDGDLHLVGVDQRGRAHYCELFDDAVRVALVDATLEVLEATRFDRDDDHELSRYIDWVADCWGWTALNDRLNGEGA